MESGVKMEKKENFETVSREDILAGIIKVVEDLTQDWDLEFEGGRGLTSKCISKETDPGVHPLSKDNNFLKNITPQIEKTVKKIQDVYNGKDINVSFPPDDVDVTFLRVDLLEKFIEELP